jgi:hypothetical protein
LSREEIDEFEFVASQFSQFHSELQALARGKGNDGLNTFKLGLLNKLLGRAHVLLGAQYEAISGFSIFDLDQVPSISDALLVMSQYIGALEKLRADNIEGDYQERWSWVIDGSISNIRTAPPAKLKR